MKKNLSGTDRLLTVAVGLVIAWFIAFHTVTGGKLVVLGMDIMGKQPTEAQLRLAEDPRITQPRIQAPASVYHAPQAPQIDHDALSNNVTHFLNGSGTTSGQN